MMGNSTDAFAVWHGVTRLGALVVPVSTRLTDAEVAYIVGDSGAALVVHDGSAVAGRAAAKAGVPTLDVSTPAVSADLAAGRAEAPVEDFLGTPVVAMTYTSGTTGRPKGIARIGPRPGPRDTAEPLRHLLGLRARRRPPDVRTDVPHRAQRVRPR